MEQKSRHASIPAYMLSVLWVRLGVRKLNAGPATCLTTTLIPAHWNPLNPNAQSLPLHRPLLPKVCRKNKFGKIVTLGSSASMFMHALCAVGSAAGENYLGSNSWQFSATQVKDFVCVPTSQYLHKCFFWLLWLCPGLNNSPQKVLLQLF